MEELQVIQGDSVNTVVTIENPKNMDIVSVVFTCPSLDIKRFLVKTQDDDEEWLLMFGPTETINFWIGRWDFDITANTSIGQQMTVVYHGQFIVKSKRERRVNPCPTNILGGLGYTED